MTYYSARFFSVFTSSRERINLLFTAVSTQMLVHISGIVRGVTSSFGLGLRVEDRAGEERYREGVLANLLLHAYPKSTGYRLRSIWG